MDGCKKYLALFGAHLWRDDVKQVSCQSVLLSEDVVLVCFEGDAVHVDDERAWRQVKGDAVLSQETLQLGGLLPQKLEGHFSAWKKEKKRRTEKYYITSISFHTASLFFSISLNVWGFLSQLLDCVHET